MTSFQILLDVLEEIYQSQLEIVEIAEHKKEALINSDLEELSKLIKQESSWIKKISKLEEERVSTIKLYFKDKDAEPDNLTITQLIDYVKSPIEKNKLIDINQRLTKTLNDIEQLNELNTQLIEQSLEFISNTINLITEESRQSYTYSKPTNKQINSSARSGVIDKKA